MIDITLDAGDWRVPADFYAAFLLAVEAPDWSGPSLDALYDGLVAKLYRVAPPFAVRVTNTDALPATMRAYLARVATVFEDARRDYGVEATITFDDEVASKEKQGRGSGPT